MMYLTCQCGNGDQDRFETVTEPVQGVGYELIGYRCKACGHYMRLKNGRPISPPPESLLRALEER